MMNERMQSEMFKRLVELDVIQIVSSRMVENDEGTRCTWIQRGKRTGLDVSNDFSIFEKERKRGT